MRLQNGTRDGIFMSYMWEKPNIKKLQIEENHTLLEVLAGTIKNEPQMWEYRKRRNLNLGFCSITFTYTNYLLDIPQ